MDKPSSKRRRTDAATALSKPFKSPLRRTAPTNTDDTPSKPVASRTTEDTEVTATPTIPVEANSISNSPDSTTTPHREIKSKVDALIEELEIATQALNLETNPKYIEIPTLVTKWRLASQDAADEVFAGAKERVNRMGGMAAWKEQSKRDATRWDFDEESREREHVDEEEEGVDNYGDVDSSGHPLNKNDIEESQDEEFTMEFMLKSLHVDPKLIGYDTKGQKWIKS
ncbi:hypothetical protein N7516_005350 [Penicillium verrucosum]|uniref:uncharacterized protein n=1 Tax=Penicillium verrucosum TaxID=60171 RepID=UPI00254524A5|nr:uncharacterized protein N7516_005350 [Penicillium verrucosum]KAJ5945182.1 hypothetical protein N7516_005350 [Penicillium verrucosum]